MPNWISKPFGKPPPINEHTWAIRQSVGKRVFVKKVPNGNACGCICSVCKAPLQARNEGKIRDTYFAHQSDSNCKGESLAHMEAKEIIKREKYIWVPFLEDPLERINFDVVDDEKLIADSNFRADLVCETKDKEIVIEIIVTHGIDKEKGEYIKDHQIPTLCINLKSKLDYYDVLPDDFDDLVLKKSDRYWFYNKKQEDEFNRQLVEQEQQEAQRIENEQKQLREDRKEELAKIKRERDSLENAYKEIWQKNKG